MIVVGLCQSLLNITDNLSEKLHDKKCVESQNKWKNCEYVQIKKVTKNIITKKDAYIKIVEVVNLTTFVKNVKGMGL